MFLLNTRSPTLMITWFLYWLTTIPPQVASDVILPSFSWDPRNECFSDSENGVSLHVDQESQMYVLCPSLAITGSVQTVITDQKNMYENMYMCTEEEFKKCELGPKPRLVLTCDKPLNPQKLTYHTFRFQQFQSGEHDLAFEVGQTYYFIATSNGTREGLGNQKHGRCRDKKMKLAITICAQGANCYKGCDKVKPVRELTKSTSLDRRSTKRPTKLPISTKNPSKVSDDPVVVVSDRSRQVSPSDKSGESVPSIKYMIIVGIGSFIVGIVVCLIVITIYKKTCRDGTHPSAYCCFNRQKLRIDKVNQEPLC